MTSSRFPAWLVLLGALIALAPLSIDMYLPSFPAVARTFGVDSGAVQLTLATYFIGVAIGQTIYGPLSDRFGRKPPLYIGLSLYILASVGCALAPSIGALAGWRFVQALGGCAGMVITRAVIRDRCGPTEAAKAFSLLMLVMGLAPILAPLIGGTLITWFSWRMIFAVLAFVALLCLIAVHHGLEETLDRSQAHPLELGRVLRNYGTLLADRHFMAYTLTGGLAMSGMFAYIAGSPFVLIELYHIPASRYGLVFGANALAYISASQLNARLLTRRGMTQILRRSIWLPIGASLATLAITLLGHPPLLVVLAGLFIYVGSLGFISPNSTAAALQHQGHLAGTASALMGSLQFTLATLAGLGMGLWHAPSSLPLAVAMSVCGGGAFLAHRLLARPLERQAQASKAEE